MAGAARAQLLQPFDYSQTRVMPPALEILVAHVQEKFDAHGQLTDEDTRARARLRNLLEALATWTQRYKPERPIPGWWEDPEPPEKGLPRAIKRRASAGPGLTQPQGVWDYCAVVGLLVLWRLG
jgi:hypothetical protein